MYMDYFLDLRASLQCNKYIYYWDRSLNHLILDLSEKSSATLCRRPHGYFRVLEILTVPLHHLRVIIGWSQTAKRTHVSDWIILSCILRNWQLFAWQTANFWRTQFGVLEHAISVRHTDTRVRAVIAPVISTDRLFYNYLFTFAGTVARLYE